MWHTTPIAYDIYHVTPCNDLKEHRESRTCWCKPCVEYENGNEIIVHNAADGREFEEALKGH